MIDGALYVDHSTLKCTDIGNAQRFALRYRDQVRFVAGWKRWLVWDGTCWRPDDRRQVFELAKEVTEDIIRWAAPKGENAREILKWGLKSQSRDRVSAMVSLAETIPELVIMPDALDSDPMLVAVANGMIDLRTGKLRPHSRDDLTTKSLPWPFDPDAACPVWTSFLHRVLGGDEDLERFMQRAIGYSLSGEVREHVLFILHGTGRNGKSTLTKAIQALLGPYAVQALDTLLLDKGTMTSHPTELADLKGARIAVCSETPKGRAFDENRVKSLTGGDRITARRMREDPWSFDPTHKLWICTNNKPNTREVNEAMRRRLRFIPFEVTISDEECDPELDAKLRAEMGGILAWAVRGCLAWQTEGLGQPQKVRESGEAYFASQDPVRRWVDTACVKGPNEKDEATVLYKAYVTWPEAEPMTQTAFGKKLSELGFESKSTKRAVVRLGLSLVQRPQGGQLVDGGQLRTVF